MFCMFRVREMEDCSEELIVEGENFLATSEPEDEDQLEETVDQHGRETEADEPTEDHDHVGGRQGGDNGR